MASKAKTQQFDDCDVCDETFNKSIRAEITCRACETSCCKVCVRHYITKSIKDAHCMNCKANWDRGFLVDTLNKSFVDGTYSESRRAVLFQREQARFPDTMEYVERMKKRIVYNDMTRNISKLRIKYTVCLNNINKVTKQNEDDDLSDVPKYFEKLHEYVMEIKTLEFTINTLKKELEDEGILKKRKVTFIHACPKEGCKGFLSTAWKCGLCENWTCPHCFELKGHMKDDPNNPHECKEENVKSAEMIKKSTKNCPKCAVPIFKLSGCDQMFCTECKIAFSWKTGEIDNGVIHNPHYFQVQRELAQTLNEEQRQALENNANRDLCGPCGDDNMPNWYLYQGIIRKLRDNDKVINRIQYKWAYSLFRQVTHLGHAIMNPMRNGCRRLQDQQELRARYMLDRISKENFEEDLVENDAIFKRNISCLQIYDLIVTIFRESVNKIAVERTAKSVNEAMNHVRKITDYANRELARLSYVYSKSLELFDFKRCEFNSVRFNKTTYLALANSGITHPTIQQPLRRMLRQTQATIKNIRKYNYTYSIWEVKCPNCKEDLSAPYYTSVWSNCINTSICLKCVFHQPNKTQELYKILEQEEQELIAHYTSKNKEKELSFVKKQLKDWNTNGFINKSKTTAKRLIGGGASK
jgi:ArsR family metal-binding transcriptional regulator